MTSDELIARLSAKEDNFVERKSDGISPRDIRKAASAFANTVEGRSAILFIGVDDRSGTIVGVRDTDGLQKRVREACEECYPPINHSCEVLQREGKDVLAVVIPPSDEKPHFTGAAYVRVGSQSVRASKERFEELVLTRIDKCREVLRYKGRGLISVRGVGYKLGSNRAMSDTHYLEQDECVVTACSAHTVTLQTPDGRIYREPLGRVEIGYDTERARPMLLVHGPRPG
jgi:hypothetical protein